MKYLCWTTSSLLLKISTFPVMYLLIVALYVIEVYWSKMNGLEIKLFFYGIFSRIIWKKINRMLLQEKYIYNFSHKKISRSILAFLFKDFELLITLNWYGGWWTCGVVYLFIFLNHWWIPRVINKQAAQLFRKPYGLRQGHEVQASFKQAYFHYILSRN